MKFSFFSYFFASFALLFSNAYCETTFLPTHQETENDLLQTVSLPKGHGPYKKYLFGTAGFRTNNPNLWYNLDVPMYPSIVELTKNRNFGFTKGKIQKLDNGIKIKKSGNYLITFNTVLVNPSSNNPLLIPVFLVKDGIFDPNGTDNIGNVVYLTREVPTPVHGTGILKNVKAGTRLSIVATNGANTTDTVAVVSWSIEAIRIPRNSR